MKLEQDPKWRLCRLICLNRDAEPYPPDIEHFCKIFEVSEEIKAKFKEAKTYCECCKLVNRYAFLFCKHYTGPASFILSCVTCENHNGTECTILDEIVEIEARELAQRDRFMLINKPPSKN